jgi:hypothetical protein
VDYRTTLDRLHQAMIGRGGDGLQVVHTHSHLEHTPTLDTDFRTRRDILALADEAANIAHTQQPTRTDYSHRETFTVHNPNTDLWRKIQGHQHYTLRALKMEGEMARHAENAITVGKRSTLFDYLIVFRTKLLLNRLPTRQERHKRNDMHEDGTSVSPHCPHCPTETETHVRALLACPHNTVAAHRIAYDLNRTIRTTTSTLFRRGTQDAAHIRAYLTSQSTPPYKLRIGPHRTRMHTAA